MKGEHSPTTPVYPRATALNGIRIIDLSMGWAGPLAARHLADLGADVIKVESCERFDWWRSWEATPEWIADNGAEKSERYNAVNRNKRNITLDLESTRGRELFLELVKTSWCPCPRLAVRGHGMTFAPTVQPLNRPRACRT